MNTNEAITDYCDVIDFIKQSKMLGQVQKEQARANLRKARSKAYHRALDNALTYTMPTYTYIAIDKRTGFYKIGRTTNITVRQKDFTKAICGNRHGTPAQGIDIIYFCDRHIEKYLHEVFDPWRVRDKDVIDRWYPMPQFQGVRTEWFNLTEQDINTIVEKFGFKPYPDGEWAIKQIRKFKNYTTP